MIKRGGLTIQTAIDPKTQDLAQKKVSAVVGAKDPLISTMNMIQPGTGLIVAMAQSRPVMGSDTKKGQTYWNLAVDPAMGGIQGYQAGLDLQGVHRGRRAGEGHPAAARSTTRSATMNFGGARLRHLQRARARSTGSWQVKNSTGTNGDDGHVQGRRDVGEHLLRPARARPPACAG